MQRSFDKETELGTLFVVATPIGNLNDFTNRAQMCLEQVDCIAAEDTRQTRKLLSHFQISTPLLSYHEHNRQSKDRVLISKLRDGESIALVSDAGLPSISDHGETIVKKAIEEGIAVVPVPGANAALSALVASGISPQPFLFIGFLPRNSKLRKKELKRWKSIPCTLICYESPHRIQSMLQDLIEILGDRQVAIARELTKKHEEWIRGSSQECLAYLEEVGTRGEYTLVIEGVSFEAEQEQPWSNLSIVEHVDQLRLAGHMKREAIKQVAKERELAKREVYNLYHQEEKYKDEV